MNTVTLDQALSQRHAARRDVVNVDERTVKLVLFTLGSACYALVGTQVQEILAGAEIYPLPGCPPSLEGVINVRGDIESVIRLHDLLHPGSQAHSAHASTILLCHSAHLRSGLRVDRVLDVVDVPTSRITPAPATLAPHLQAIVTGMLQWQAQPVCVLDLERLLQDYCSALA